MPKDDSVRETWESSEEQGMTQDWESSSTKRNLGGRFKQHIKNKIAEAKENRAYRKSPEYRRKRVDMLNLEAEEEIAKAKKAKARSVRIKAQLEPFQKLGEMGGMGSGGMLAKKDSFSGMDDIFGIGGGSSQSYKTPKASKQKQNWQGMNDLFGLG